MSMYSVKDWMQKLCCSFHAKIVNHLYYADDLALIAPSSNGMQKLITECECYAEVYGMKFNEMKSVLSPFYPSNFRFALIAPIVPAEASCWYLEHIIINDLNANEDIRRQPRLFFFEGQACYYVPSGNVHMHGNYFCLCPVEGFCAP